MYSVNDISDTTFGRLQIAIGNTRFESVFVPGQTKKLYVQLSTIGDKTTEYPKFTRVSWVGSFDGYYICFDDPTRYEKNLAPAFYFGSKEENYLQYLVVIINKIASVHSIPYDCITFVSSSNGGFAALWLADKFAGSKCIALCPQVDVIDFNGRKFFKILEIKRNELCFYKDRFQIFQILKNTQSHFFIFSNIQCDYDLDQMKILYKKAGIKFQLGLSQLSSNVKCLLAKIDAPDPHLAQPIEGFVKVIENTMIEPVSNELCNIYNSYIEQMQKAFGQMEKSFKMQCLQFLSKKKRQLRKILRACKLL